VVAKTLGELLGRILLHRHPELATMERMRSKRPTAVYIDTGQTGRSRAIVAPYSVRAYAGARVSTPLHWDEVGFGLDPSVHTMFTVPERVRGHADPMADMLDQQPDIEAAVTALGGLLEGAALTPR
jgi:bifunctional non-homologous end joining protein LigD